MKTRLFAVVFFAACVCVLIVRHWSASGQPRIEAMTVQLCGSDYLFHFRYPGPDQKLNTPDDRVGTKDLFVPAGAKIHLKITSNDFAYTVEVPEYHVYEIAAPDLFFDVTIGDLAIGQTDLWGTQMCGYEHPDLLGRLIVQSQEEFQGTVTKMALADAM